MPDAEAWREIICTGSGPAGLYDTLSIQTVQSADWSGAYSMMASRETVVLSIVPLPRLKLLHPPAVKLHW